MKMSKSINIKKTLVVNLLAGPGSGKSTMATSIFSELKWRGVDCELATEYAKDVTWEKSFKKLECQPYIFGKQLYRIARVNGQVDVVVSDSPIILSLIYDKEQSPEFRDFILHENKKFFNINIFLERQKKYNPNGRTQTENEAKEIDKKILKKLDEVGISYVKYVSCKESIIPIVEFIESKINI